MMTMRSYDEKNGILIEFKFIWNHLRIKDN